MTPPDPLLDLYQDSGGSAAGRAEAITRYAFAVPSDTALDAIVRSAPHGIVELGAGTGYWAARLEQRGADVMAFDTAPAPSAANKWFAGAEPSHTVHRGDIDVVDDFPERCLLLIWPTRNETWPADAVQRFHRAGGQTIAYIGEPPGGRTGDDVFHRLLGAIDHCYRCTYDLIDHPCVCAIPTAFEIVSSATIPTWQGYEDRLGIYQRVDDVTRRPSRGRWFARRRRR